VNSDSPRRYKASYASSMAAEIEKNVVLAPGELILHSQFVRERKNWLTSQPRMLAITPLQIILLEHNLFSADWINEIPRSAVRNVSLEKNFMNDWVIFAYSDIEEIRSVRIQPMQKHVSKQDNQELLTVLNAFHCGQLNSLVQNSIHTSS
jgi:hypothetical protein